MIPRILVPTQLLPPAEEYPAQPQRLSSSLDSRTVVPSDLPFVPLDGRTNIPAHIPLEVLGQRTVVPRDMLATPLQARSEIPAHVPLTVLDSRIAVPTDARPAELRMGRMPAGALGDIIEPDVLLTGQVHLLVRPVEERAAEWRWVSQAGTLLLHTVMISLAFFWPTLFPYRPPSQSQLELASRSLGMVYLPPSVRDVPREAPQPAPPSAQMRIDPRVLRQLIPEKEPSPLPGAAESPKVERELPAAPTPQTPAAPELRAEAKPEPLKLETPKEPQPNKLLMPRMSPGRALEDSVRGATRGGGTTSGGFSDRIPARPGEGGAGPGGGGGGEGYLGGGIQMLTPDEGVDFSNYLARVLASVKRNWYAVIPESARMGERGRVVIQFRIMKDGSVPYPEPNLVMTSGKEPLDRAAMSSIRASNPFEPLPPAFSGPFIELRFIFLYNLPLDYR